MNLNIYEVISLLAFVFWMAFFWFGDPVPKKDGHLSTPDAKDTISASDKSLSTPKVISSFSVFDDGWMGDFTDNGWMPHDE